MSYDYESDLEQRRMMYITSLLNETLPTKMLDDALLMELDIQKEHAFGVIQIMLSTEIQRAIEAKDLEDVADWKANIRLMMLQALDAPWIHSACFLNLAPYTRTIVYSYEEDRLTILPEHIKTWFAKVNEGLKNQEGGEIMAFANPSLTPFNHIGKLYKNLRKLQDYRFVIGMGNLVFFEDFNLKEDYSVSEYKYLHRYESLLAEEDYEGLLLLSREFTDYIWKHQVRDSKVTYVYKEMLAMTIRFLYAHETDHLKTIEMLNGAISDFSGRFNDLTEVADFVRNVIEDLRSQAVISEMAKHPHIRRVLRMISQRYMEDLTLDAIADGMNLSAPHLSRLFKDEVGITYKQYLTRYRLDRIKELLLNTNKTVGEIAELTGYQTANQLTRIFRKYEQMTPRDYRSNPLS